MSSENRMGWLLLAVLLNVAPLSAQVVTGAISGRITDTTGAVIPGATVQVQNVETGLTRNVQSDAAGRYEARNLPAGSYRVTVQQTGFRTEVRSGITLSVGSAAAVNIELSVGAVQEKVEVTGEAPTIETTTATLSNLVNGTQIRDLPLNGRSLDQLALLTPGVVQQTQAGRSTLSGEGMRLVINGARPTQVLYLLDGTVASDYSSAGPGGASTQSLGVEAIREFRILTHSFSAEYGRNAIGGVFSAITRSGTNEFHGSVYEFVRNNIFDARNFFNISKAPAPSPLPPFRRNQFGGSFGGRLVRDRLFFFLNYEGLRQSQGNPLLATVPDLNARQGLVANATNTSFTQITGSWGTGPNPAVLPYLNLLPKPNGQVLGGGVARYSRDVTQTVSEDYSMERMDFRLSDKDSFYLRYVYDPSSNFKPTVFDPFFSADEVVYHFTVLSETHVFSPTSLNEFRFAFNRTFPHTTPGPLLVENHALDFVPGAGFGNISFTGTAVPGSSLTALTTLGNAANLPKYMQENLFQGTDTFSYIHGAHSLKFGFDLERLQLNTRGMVFPQQRGVYSFPSLTAFLQGLPTQLAFPLIGGASSAERGYRQIIFGWFAQDDYRVRPNLTLNIGLRHEFVTSPNEVNGKMGSIRALTDRVAEQGPAFFTRKANFGPRFGLAWDPTGSGKMSIRAGTGMFYALAIMNKIWDTSTFAYPWATTISVNNPPNFPNALRSGFTEGTQATRGVEPDLATTTSVHWNLEIQRQLSNSMSVQVGYVGSHNYHLEQGPQANRFVGAQILPDGRKFFPTGLPRINPFYSTIQWATVPGWSNYNGLQLGFQKRFSQGLQLQAGYTWSKNLSSVDAQIGGDVAGQVVGPMDLDDLRRDYGLSSFYQEHVFNISGKYRMPWDNRLKSGVSKAALGGWEINSAWRATTGPTQVVPVGFNVSRSGDPLSSDRPNLNPGFSGSPTHGVTAGCPGVAAGQKLGTPDLYFDPCAFSLPDAGTYGNLARNTLIGPGLFNVDFGLVKNTALTSLHEGMNLEFRAEFFNLLNRANFTNPAASLFLATGGRNTNAGKITATSVDSRQIQFGLKLTF